MLRNHLGLHKILLALILASFSLFLSSCEEDTATAISAAQDCLNEMRSTMTQAELAAKGAECRTLLGTATSEKGFIVECSSFFLQEGFFASKIVDAFDRVKDQEGGNNNALNLMSTFSFSSTANANSANTACQQTGIKTFKVFGDLAKAATAIGSAFPAGLDALIPNDGSSPSLADFEAALNNLTDPVQLEALGSAVVSLAGTLCETEGDGGTAEDACATLETVSGSANIGACMKFCMQDGNKGVACNVDATITCP